MNKAKQIKELVESAIKEETKPINESIPPKKPKNPDKKDK